MLEMRNGLRSKVSRSFGRSLAALFLGCLLSGSGCIYGDHFPSVIIRNLTGKAIIVERKEGGDSSLQATKVAPKEQKDVFIASSALEWIAVKDAASGNLLLKLNAGDDRFEAAFKNGDYHLDYPLPVATRRKK